MSPVDTYANNTSVGYRFPNQGVFAYSPIYLDCNIIRDARWWNAIFFRRIYRESRNNFKFSVKPKMK